jgi:transcriptional regulator with XRE-family HTH domain
MTCLPIYRPAPEPTKAVVYDIGLALAVIRHGKGMTQDQLAKKLRTTRQQVSDIEHGRQIPTIQSVKKLAKVLEMKPRTLVAIAEAA